MDALVILAILGSYIALAVFATRGAVWWAAKKGASTRQRWLWGTGVALIFYLIPFWDWLPTVLAHQYLCATEGKFEIRKTLEQWKIENRDIIAGLRHQRDAKIVKIGEYHRLPLNQRLASERKDPDDVFLSILRGEGRIIDTKNGEVLVRYVDFYTPGGAGGWKLWLRTGHCKGESRGRGGFDLIELSIRDLGSSR